ncbi:FG-GAP repeat domain-containing protein [Streptomyces lavendulocolor]|uniref:FG-GAP repeat domain-containing protein n=1 Tax=Streptomyces lavendulocolor TaxID=67316 RepID=UPI003C2E89E1
MGGQFETSRRLGTGWNQFNVLTSPGDMTGDGRADLIARQATTGDMYLYANDGTGGLKAKGRIGTNWKLYRAVLGAGDLNGDSIGDVLAVDRNDSLWRYTEQPPEHSGPEPWCSATAGPPAATRSWVSATSPETDSLT